jgi:hypothetical protein
MKSFIIIFAAIVCAQCGSSNEPHSNVKATQVDSLKVYVKPNVEGHWKLIQTEIIDSVPFIAPSSKGNNEPELSDPEGGPFEYVDVPDLIFSGDSMFRVDYPMELFGASTFSLDTNYLNFDGKYGKTAMPISVNQDTMQLYLREGRLYLKETYHKTHFDDSIVSILKRDTLNFPLLEGKWILKRDYWYDYGTHYALDFPHTIPDSIVITRAQIIARLHRGRSYKMRTSGTREKYYLNYRKPYLHLIPGEWFKDEDPYIHFERSKTE